MSEEDRFEDEDWLGPDLNDEEEDAEWTDRCRKCGRKVGREKLQNMVKVDLTILPDKMADGGKCRGGASLFMTKPMCPRCLAHLLGVAAMNVAREVGLFDPEEEAR